MLGFFSTICHIPFPGSQALTLYIFSSFFQSEKCLSAYHCAWLRASEVDLFFFLEDICSQVLSRILREARICIYIGYSLTKLNQRITFPEHSETLSWRICGTEMFLYCNAQQQCCCCVFLCDYMASNSC